MLQDMGCLLLLSPPLCLLLSMYIYLLPGCRFAMGLGNVHEFEGRLADEHDALEVRMGGGAWEGWCMGHAGEIGLGTHMVGPLASRFAQGLCIALRADSHDVHAISGSIATQ